MHGINASTIGRYRSRMPILPVSPPHGLALLESGDHIELVSASDCGR